MATIETVKLIFSNLGDRSYKQWRGELDDSGNVTSYYGAVGATEQVKRYGCMGKSFLDKKVKEKIRKGYEHVKTLDSAMQNTPKAIAGRSLAEIALAQIRFASPTTKSLITRLADSNVHKITSSANIVFNKDSGLFQTPLGVVTPEAISEARQLLSFFDAANKVDAKYKKNIDGYLRLIPRNKGYRMTYEGIFPDKNAIQKENDLLDALENSVELVTKPKADSSNKATEAPIERVFDLEMDMLADNNARDKVIDWFARTNKAMHNYTNRRIGDIYAVDIKEYNRDFDDAIGNIVEVFHGSSQANILSILKSGLMPSPPATAAIAGKMFGAGTYGSTTASKALGYTLGRWGQSSGDSGWLFVCDFAMGNAFYPTGSLSQIPSGFDSCWALPAKTRLLNDELIVYKSKQIRIKYLLEIK